MRARVLLFSFFVISIFSFGTPVHARSQTGDIPGIVTGVGTHFQIADSDYLNVSLDSTESLKMRLMSMRGVLTMRVQSAGGVATSTQITITGLMASTTYYQYEDDLHNLVQVVSDESGAYTYTQDISEPHTVFIQTRHSTKFINNATGGDCASFGTWNAGTLTCTLTADVAETIEIDIDGVTLDGAGHTMDGGQSVITGIYVDTRTGITIKNLTIKNFSCGVFLNASSHITIADTVISDSGITSFDSSENAFIGDTFSGSGRAFISFNSSGDTMRDDQISGSTDTDGVFLFTSTGGTIASSTFSGLGKALFLYDGSDDTTISGNTFTDSGDALFLYDSIENTITDNTISGANHALFLFSSHDNTIAQNTFSSSTEALFVYDSSYGNTMYHNNFLHSGTNVMDYSGMNNAFSLPKPAGGNYFDSFDESSEGCDDVDADGICDAPYVFTQNYDAGRDILPWTMQNGWGDAPIAHVNNHSSVLFLPGIESSRLYRPNYNGGTDKLWEPNIDSDVQDLYMNPDGTSIRSDVYTKERDVLDELPDGENIYKSFIGKMNELKTNGTIADWEPIAYDWRLSLDDILHYGNDIQGRIYYSGELNGTSTPYIIQELRRLAKSSKTNKVTIVAHSNGGLLAKRLTEILGPTESAKLIDKMIFVAVPQAGTPASIAAGLHGYDQENVWGLVTTKNTARTLANAAPMEYQLLPSEKYFTYVDNPVITFDSALTDWISQYGETIHSQDRLHKFLIDTFGRVDPQTGDINQPVKFDDALLSDVEFLHEDLDTWTPPTGVQLTQIAGWGIPKTVDGIIYKKKGTGVTPEADLTIDGDGAVVVPSALWTSTTTGAVNYWMDLKSYNKSHVLDTFGGLRPFGHGNILETDSIMNFVSDQISNTIKTLSDYTYLSTEAPINSNKRLQYSLHSPLTLNLYDAVGHHTGISTTTRQVEEQIPGTYYMEFGDVKYIFSDASIDGNILMNGYDSGTFTFNVDEYNGDTLTTSTTFKDVPTTASTTVTLDVQSGGVLSPMVIDENGDGGNVFMLTSKAGGTVSYEPSAPTPAPQTRSTGNGGRHISIPSIVPTLVATITSTNSPQAIEVAPVTIIYTPGEVATKPFQAKKKASVPIVPSEKVNTNVSQTASVYEVSQRSVLQKLGAIVYNGLSGIWAALMRFFY